MALPLHTPMYTPKIDNHTINSDKRDPALQVVTILLIAIGMGIAVIAVVFFTFQLLLQNVSPTQEQKWFSFFDHVIEGKVIEDPEMKEIFSRAGITEHIKVKVMCNPDMNAFAWPGGNIVLTSQLLKNIDTEEGLAFVLGHEMGHIKNRDHLKGMARSFTFLFVDMFTGLSQWPGAGALLGVIESAYSRDQEHLADNIALQQMKTTYGHTKGGDEFFVAVQAEPSEKFHKAFWFVSSHPLTEERLKFFEKQNQDFLSERAITQRRDLFDKVLCDSGCEPSLCAKARSGSPKSQLHKRRHEPISLKDPSTLPGLFGVLAT
ncbi:MAG: M48 family metallopeptidase [Bdellovibrionaceae bacterium]|nr:M48 family metallopeptidase [Pseudobdellovibrionaceae bacterium]